jgi:hypothetical protein
MITDMKSLAGRISCAIAILLSSPVVALAEDEELRDARMEGYAGSVQLEPGSSALTYLLFFFLSVVAAAVVFKNAKRTHLD